MDVITPATWLRNGKKKKSMYWCTRIGDTEQGGKRKMAKIASELKRALTKANG